MKQRNPGISVLIATQNEEPIVESCIRSFLDFGDEIIVVDNGSVDRTKEIVRELVSEFPKKLSFYDCPELPDLYHNRQYAFARSSYEWVMRADSDYVAYTSGKQSVLKLRDFLLTRKKRPWPDGVLIPQVNVTGDFWHTGTPRSKDTLHGIDERRCVPDVFSAPMLRIYRIIPFFRFRRMGRWEAVRFHRLYTLMAVKWPQPVWMHCNIKSDLNYFLRSERTNWRAIGDYGKYPTLDSYVHAVLKARYPGMGIEEASHLYVTNHVLKFVHPYDPLTYCPYPTLVKQQMKTHPTYRIYHENGRIIRTKL